MFDISNKKIVDLSIMMDPTDPNHAKETQWIKQRGTIPPAYIPEERIVVEPYIFMADRCMCEWLTMWSHAGTHLEVAIHSYVYGATDIPEKMHYSIGDVPLEDLCGEGYAIDLTFVGKEKKESDPKVIMDRLERLSVSGPQVFPEDIEKWEERNNTHIEKGDIVFLHTRLEIPDIPIIPKETCSYLVRRRRIKAIGTNDHTIIYGGLGHMFLHERRMPVVEMLTNLEKIGNQRAYFIISPLPIKGIGGSPARVLAFVDEIIEDK
ncbi:MAG: cyclase family protein [Promethearchaeota archaeon]